jgi:hypothetical protein
LASSNNALPDDGDYTETCRSCFNVNFNTVLNNYLVHQVVNKNTLINPGLFKAIFQNLLQEKNNTANIFSG